MAKVNLPSLVDAEKQMLAPPASGKLNQPVSISAAISRIIAAEQMISEMSHYLLYLGICQRYALGRKIADDEEAFAVFVEDKRIKGLARPPKNASDTLRCLFAATYADTKKASKYYRRVKSLWDKRRSAKAVLAFLKNKGLSDPKPERLPPTLANEGATAEGMTTELPLATEEAPGGGILGWPGKPKVGRRYRLTIMVLEHECGATTIEVLDAPELLR